MAVVVSASAAQAAPGDLDPSFGSGGKVSTAIGPGDNGTAGIALQGNGKVVVAGTADSGTDLDFAVVRYNADGTLDPSFGGGGKVMITVGPGDDVGRDVAIQSDGKVVVAGTTDQGDDSDFALVRLDANGVLDPSFGAGGKVITGVGPGDDDAASLVIQGDGKVVMAGTFDDGTDLAFAVVRHNANGTLDSSFGAGGKVVTGVGPGDDVGKGVTIQGDGKVVVAGTTDTGDDTDFAVVRYNANGALDSSFGSGGKVVTGVGTGDDAGKVVAIQADGKVVVAGTTDKGDHTDFAVVRYNANGTLDPAFGAGGKLSTGVGPGDDAGKGIHLQSDGKVVVAGTTDAGTDADFAVVRYNANGALDSSFGSGGKVIAGVGKGHDDAGGIARQADDKLVVAGTTDNGIDSDVSLIRLLGDPLPSLRDRPGPANVAAPERTGNTNLTVPESAGNGTRQARTGGNVLALAASGALLLAGGGFAMVWANSRKQHQVGAG